MVPLVCCITELYGMIRNGMVLVQYGTIQKATIQNGCRHPQLHTNDISILDGEIYNPH